MHCFIALTGHMFYWPKGLQWTEILWLWCCDVWCSGHFIIQYLTGDTMTKRERERERERENYSQCYVLCSNIYIFTNFRAVPSCPYICIFCVDSIIDREMRKCGSLWFCVLFWVIFLCMVWQLFYAVKVKVRWFKAVEMCLLSGFFFLQYDLDNLQNTERSKSELYSWLKSSSFIKIRVNFLRA